MIPKDALDLIRARLLTIEELAYKTRWALTNAPATEHEVKTICDRIRVDLDGIERIAQGREIGS